MTFFNRWNEIEESLKPCPFCGERAEMDDGVYTYGYEIYISCINCSAKMTAMTENDWDELIKEWNRRDGEE